MTEIDPTAVFVTHYPNYNGTATTTAADYGIDDLGNGTWRNDTSRYLSTSGEAKLDMTYAVFEGLVALMAVVGNAMVIAVFKRERRLRRRTNFYIVSLAVADFLVGLLGVPFAVLSSVGLPRNLYACLFTISLLIVLCTISIFCLVAVSVDRYWAILHPMAYSRNVRTKTAIVIISLCWLAGSVVGFLPLFGWHETPQVDTCLFLKVMDYDYLIFLYISTIITPALIMLAFYAHIYRVIVKQLRQIVTMNPAGGLSTESRRSSESSRIRVSAVKTGGGRCKSGNHGGTMLRVLGAAQKREVKATQNLSIIVLFFMICWMPLYTINCIKAFCRDCNIPSTLMLFCIILSHLNSAVNPLLYAYHLKDFRAAMRNLILSMFGYDVTTQELNYRASLASQQQFAQRHSIMDKRHSLQPKIYIDSPVYLRAQQQQIRRQQSQQRSLERSESGASFHSLNKKRLISTTRSDPGSPNVLISTTAISASPAESNCSSPQRYGPRNNVMWGIAEVSSINEDSGHRRSLEDSSDQNGVGPIYGDSEDLNVPSSETVEETSLEVTLDDIDKDKGKKARNQTKEEDFEQHQLPEPKCQPATEDDRNVSSLYSAITNKRRSHSTCCVLQDMAVDPQLTADSIYLIENHSPTRILATNHVIAHQTMMTINANNNSVSSYGGNCTEDVVDDDAYCNSLALDDNVNNNNRHSKRHISSPTTTSLTTATKFRQERPSKMSQSFSLFNNSTQSPKAPLSPIISVVTSTAMTPPTPVDSSGGSSHSSLFKLFSSSATGAKQRMRSFRFNKRSLSNDK